MTTTRAAPDPTTAVLDRAWVLARAIGDSAAFRAFEAAQEALDADADLVARVSALQIREQELPLSRTWVGADSEEVRAIEREWEDLAGHPVLAAHLAARDELVGLHDVLHAVRDATEGCGSGAFEPLMTDIPGCCPGAPQKGRDGD